jgi:predicted RNA-binding protein with PIN domain
MALQWLVDGYNLMHLSRELRREMETDLLAAINHLVALLDDFSQRKRGHVTVVFDGSPPAGPAVLRPSASVRVHFAGPEKKADPVIRQMVAGSRERSTLIVVSADRELADYARICGARVEHPSQFEKQLQEAPSLGNGEMLAKYDRGLAEDEIEEWLRLFQRAPDGEGER